MLVAPAAAASADDGQRARAERSAAGAASAEVGRLGGNLTSSPAGRAARPRSRSPMTMTAARALSFPIRRANRAPA